MKLFVIILFLILLNSCSSSNQIYYGNGFYKTHIVLKKSGKVTLEEKHFESKKIIKPTGSYLLLDDTLYLKYNENSDLREVSYLLTDSCLKKNNKCLFHKVDKKKF